ncbi:MAG: bifunctional phosphopantothenoylcysteine decarboxylase/phosphopantothenate--cysteine ligase CoaBC [Nitrospirae bacterium]|nr:MAG: bifunctional phosphopantothenoylcysteine decarboxylase/phosphopantothenate--cysteine ligase CoaBC [Nitrospirota bacterium]
MPLAHRRILLGVTGSIAAYKAVTLLRTLRAQGADVRVVMTSAAKRFVTPLTFEVLSGHPVVDNLFSDPSGLPHIRLPEEADLILIAPCTANRLAKYALGIADDLLSTLLLTTARPVILAPAMDGAMWRQPALMHHVETLRARGVTVLDPESGPLASGQWGEGRMPGEEAILSALRARLSAQRDWQGHRFLISAGPTREAIDPVRFLSNGSTGKMGYAIAEAAVQRGGEVVLVSGPTELLPPAGVEQVSVVSAEEMYQALSLRFPWATVLIMAAAVSDFRPRKPLSDRKIKKDQWNGEPLELERTPDILAALSAQRTHQCLVGFAAETEDVLRHGHDKLMRKRLDMVVVNRVGGSESAFGSETNDVFVLTKHGATVHIPRSSKRAVADRILDELHRINAPACTSEFLPSS